MTIQSTPPAGGPSLRDRILQARADTQGAWQQANDLVSRFHSLKVEAYDCYNACYPAYSFANSASTDTPETDHAADGAGLLAALDTVQADHARLQSDGSAAEPALAAARAELQRVEDEVAAIVPDSHGDVQRALQDALGYLHSASGEQGQVAYQPASGLSDAQHGVDQAKGEGAAIAADTEGTNVSWNGRIAMMDIDDARSGYMRVARGAGDANSAETQVAPPCRSARDALDRALAALETDG